MKTLSVVMFGRLAGIAAADATAPSRVGFEYVSDYLASPEATPLSVSVPLQPGRHEVGVWLDGLLSDNHLVRLRWQAQYGTPTTTAMDLLASPVGRDCAGAVQCYPPADTDATLARGGGARRLAEGAVAGIIDGLRKDEAAWCQSSDDSAFALAGAQAKTALRHDRGDWSLPYGDSPTTHILKPGIAGYPDSDVIEHVCQRAAAFLGITAAETVCVTAHGERALLVTRFDRSPLGAAGFRRVHQEDMCQALGVPATRKYQSDRGPSVAQIAGLLWATSSDSDTDVRLFRDALIYNWIIAGTDAHAKNYSLLLNGGEARLAPLYDVCSFLPYRHHTPVRKIKLAMKIGKDYTIHKADYRPAWERTAAALGLPAQETLDRAQDLARRAAACVERAIRELPAKLRGSPHVALLADEVKRRALHCQFVSHMGHPSEYSKLTPSVGAPSTPEPDPDAEHPVTRMGCTHVGERSHVRCRLAAGHNLPHRYTR